MWPNGQPIQGGPPGAMNNYYGPGVFPGPPGFGPGHAMFHALPGPPSHDELTSVMVYVESDLIDGKEFSESVLKGDSRFPLVTNTQHASTWRSVVGEHYHLITTVPPVLMMRDQQSMALDHAKRTSTGAILYHKPKGTENPSNDYFVEFLNNAGFYSIGHNNYWKPYIVFIDTQNLNEASISMQVALRTRQIEAKCREQVQFHRHQLEGSSLMNDLIKQNAMMAVVVGNLKTGENVDKVLPLMEKMLNFDEFKNV